MKLNLMRGDFEKLGLSRKSAERVRSTNYHLTDYMGEALLRHPSFAETFGVKKEEVDRLRDNPEYFRKLMAGPFMVVIPTLTEIADWQCLIRGSTTTLAVDKVKRQMPILESLDKAMLYYNNRAYIWLMAELLNASILAAPLLGMSQELATYLRDLPQHELDLAVSRITFPLFRWRLQDQVFFMEYSTNRMSSELLAHYFMRFPHLRAARPEKRQEWTYLRLDRLHTDVYCSLLTIMGCRASSVSSLLNIPAAKARKTYMEIHGQSSPCGQMPSSVGWFFEKTPARVQATLFLWLYRLCLNQDANVPEALIAAYNILEKAFSSDLRLAPDRACYLARATAEETEVSIAPCRSCGTDYLIANAGPKIELSGSFCCPSCNGTLSAPARGRRGDDLR